MIIRKANIYDCKLLYNWAVEKEVRNNSFKTSIFSYDQHQKWYKNKLKSMDSVIYIFEIDAIPIGQIRLDFLDNQILLDYSIDKNYRGKGHSKKMINLLLKKIQDRFKNYSVIAHVKKENTPSVKVFSSLGFEKKSNENTLTFCKKI